MTQPAPRPRDSSPATRDIVVGATVYGADNGRFGQVAGSYRNFLIVERGFFMPVDYYVPMSAIGRVDGDLVVLSVSRDAALTQGWERPPFTSETGQRGIRRPTVGRAGPVAPVGRRAEQPATNAASAATSWPAAPSRTTEESVPATGGDPDVTHPPVGVAGPGTTGQPVSQPVVDPAGAVPAMPAARPAAIPATGAFADTYAVGTNTESYHAMTGFPADPVSPTPDQPAPEAVTPATTVPAVTPAATESAEPDLAAVERSAGEDIASAGGPEATSEPGPDQSAPTNAEPPPVERPAP